MILHPKFLPRTTLVNLWSWKLFPNFVLKYFPGSFSSHNFSGEMFPRNAPKIFSREIYIESKVSLSNDYRKNYLPEPLPRTTLIQKTLPQFCFQIFSWKFFFLGKVFRYNVPKIESIKECNKESVWMVDEVSFIDYFFVFSPVLGARLAVSNNLCLKWLPMGAYCSNMISYIKNICN